MTWHLSDGLVDQYVTGTLAGARAASVEAHTMACDQCRAELVESARQAVPSARLSAVWAEVQAEVDAPRPTWGERLALRLGVDADEARLVATAPSLRASWLAALVLVLGFAGLAPAMRDGTPLLLLVVAPLVPVLAVAGAYGRLVDSSFEVAQATPYPAGRLLLLRVLAVLVVSLAITAMFTLAFSQGWRPLVWLLPALAMVSLSLVLARWLPLALAAAGVSTTYLLVVATSIVEGPDVTVVFEGTAGWAWAAVLVGCLAILASPPHRRAIRRLS